MNDRDRLFLRHVLDAIAAIESNVRRMLDLPED